MTEQVETATPNPTRERGVAPSKKLPAADWAKRNLFRTPANALLSIVLGVFAAYVGYRFLRFVFITGRWDPVRVNLELFMIGQFPREERWRIIAQLIIMSGSIGAAVGSLRSASIDRSTDAGIERVPEGWRVYFSNYWAVGLLGIAILAGLVTTIGPWLVAGASLAAAVVAYAVTGFLPRRLRVFGWTLSFVAGVLSFQMLSGSGGWAWFYMTLALAPLVRSEVGPLVSGLSASAKMTASIALTVASLAVGIAAFVISPGLFGLIFLLIGLFAVVQFLSADRVDAALNGATMVLGVVAFFVYRSFDLEGVDWADWGGFHLNIVMATAAIAISFPIGVMLALGRRSELPAVRFMSVSYIEFFRGAPLITFLLSAQLFLGFFLNSDSPLSEITRAIAALTLFSAAYVAENVRGGLQAVPNGQVEAAQASGMSPPKIMRLIVMPQALRAVIPAMVGQFISLWKDTTLLAIINIRDLLGVRRLVHAQEAFRGFGIGETLVFVAFGFWAVAYTMSRESQRLENNLGVGQR